uniref:Putative secreted salivary peptide of 6.78 kDa n=1 Tax=Ixodes ricinus TaxID=34613 RepID=V5H314_IXORI
MNILIVCIVIANVVISQGNVEEAGRTNSEIQERSLLIFDHQECRYLGYKMEKRGSKRADRPLCQMDLPGQSDSATSSGVLTPCPTSAVFLGSQFQVAVGGLQPYEVRLVI